MLGNSGYGHCRWRQQQQQHQRRRYTCVMPKSDALNILFWINIYTGYFCAVYSRSSISLFCAFSVRCLCVFSVRVFGAANTWFPSHIFRVNRMENLVLVNRRMDESMNNAPTKKTEQHIHTRHECAKKKTRCVFPKKKRIDHKIWSWFFVEVSCGCVFCCCCSCFWFDLIWLRVKLAATIYENHGKSYFRRKSKQQCNNTSMYTLCKSDMSTVTL